MLALGEISLIVWVHELKGPHKLKNNELTDYIIEQFLNN
jgi:hypothetical protein